MFNMALLVFLLSLCLALPVTRARAASEDAAAAPEISQPASLDVPAAPAFLDSALLSPGVGASLVEFAPLSQSDALPHAAVVAPKGAAARAGAPASASAVLPASAAALERAPAHEAAAAVPAENLSASASPRAPPRVAVAQASDLAPSAAPERKGAAASAGEKASEVFDGGRRLNVLTAGAEAVPFIKTGGLADVVDAVSRGLAARGHRVMLVLPKYRGLKLGDAEFKPAGEISVPMGEGVQIASLLAAKVNGVDVVLIDHAGYYDRPGGPYQGQASSYSEDDNDERFAFYARAALEAARALDFKPDVVHAHDWHAALIPVFLKSAYAADPFFAGTKTAITIHNLAFQGLFAPDIARRLGLPPHYLEPMAPLEYWGKASYLKAGLVLADAVTTVSPTYAREILGEEFGMGMHGVLQARQDGVRGILNGLDLKMWDPATDPVAPRNYAAEDAAEGKAANKAWLQNRLGLDAEPEAPLFAVASRLAHQKGIDVAVAAIDEMVARGAQVVITGSGDKELENAVAAAVLRHPGRVAAHPFDESFVRVVYAAADFLLMPSRFEPCGLSQLIAQRYGALPLVTRTGGLADTVTDLRENAQGGDGLVMREPSAAGLIAAVDAAVELYRAPESFAAARATAMAKDSSWGRALDAYEALYRELLGETGSPRPDSADEILSAGDTGVVRTPDVAAGLEFLRESSYPLDPQVARFIEAIRKEHPELPVSPERVFLIRDPAVLARLGLPEAAGGAARILTDGRAEIPVVLIAAAHGVPADQFVEFTVHEAVHLMDGGILRVPNGRVLSHFFAEGWTQKRAVEKANDVLPRLGLPRTPSRAYRKEVALADAFLARHGASALDELVRAGSDEGLRRALGSRWDFAVAISRCPAPREKKLNALIALVNAPSFGPAEENALRDYLNL